jgi:hypothetical protein
VKEKERERERKKWQKGYFTVVISPLLVKINKISNTVSSNNCQQ